MILEYFRPTSIDEAMKLIKRQHPKTIALAGGSTLAKRDDDVAVVDLQALSLSYMKQESGMTCIGATTTLDAIINNHRIGEPFVDPIKIQVAKNQRMTATLGGLICAANGRSPVLTVLLALDALIKATPGDEEISLAKWLPIRAEWTTGKLVTEIKFESDVKCIFDSIGRSPLDQPIVCCAAVKTKKDQIRLAIGGFGLFPKVFLAGDETKNIDQIIETQLADASDEWASAEYRKDAAKKLAARLINSF